MFVVNCKITLQLGKERRKSGGLLSSNPWPGIVWQQSLRAAGDRDCSASLSKCLLKMKKALHHDRASCIHIIILFCLVSPSLPVASRNKEPIDARLQVGKKHPSQLGFKIDLTAHFFIVGKMLLHGLLSFYCILFYNGLINVHQGLV